MNKGTNETGNKVGTFDGGETAWVFNAAGGIVGEIEKGVGYTSAMLDSSRVESYTVWMDSGLSSTAFKVNGTFFGFWEPARIVTDGYETARKALAAAKAYAKTAQPAPEAPEAPEAEEATA